MISFLLLSGGVGTRSRHHEPKQFYELGGHPMIAHSIIAAVKADGIAEILVNAPDGFEERTREIVRNYGGNKPFRVLPCGKTRQESSRILADAARHDCVILHEAARPLMGRNMLEELITCQSPNAGFCHPIPFSMCRIDPETKLIREGVSRDEVFDIQLPQKFERSVLQEAHKKSSEDNRLFTEDAVMVVTTTGTPVFSLTGSSKNFKITDKEDFAIAEQVMKWGEK